MTRPIRPHVVAVAQARLGSSRLPGKVLLDLDGSALVDHVMAAIGRAQRVDRAVLAVPYGDHELIGHARSSGWDVVTGPPTDVLHRYQMAAAHAGADVIVRVTADCPLLDHRWIDRAVDRFERQDADYLTLEGFPRGLADVEVMTRDALDRAAQLADSPQDREHVCTYFGDHPDEFEIVVVGPPPNLDHPALRCCVDESADLHVVRTLVERFGRGAPADTYAGGLIADAGLRSINEDVEQRSFNSVTLR